MKFIERGIPRAGLDEDEESDPSDHSQGNEETADKNEDSLSEPNKDKIVETVEKRPNFHGKRVPKRVLERKGSPGGDGVIMDGSDSRPKHFSDEL